MTPTNIVKQFLAGLRRTRNGHRSSAAATYWSAAEALAAGREPTCKPAALAEALERLGKTEADLERDAHLLAEQQQAQSVAAKETAAVQRHKAAVGAKAAADQKAAALEQQAKQIRAEAEAAVVEAGRELNGVRKASSRVAELSRELAKRQHPAHVQHADEAQRDRQAEALQNDLATAEREVVEAEKAVATWPQNLLDGPVDSALAGGARRAARQLAVARDRRDQLAKQLAELRGGASDDTTGEDVTADIMSEEVTP